MAAKKGLLNVTGPNKITELRVLDANLREVAAGIYHLQVKLPPGIYRVEAQIPGDRAAKLVAVEPGSEKSVSGFDLKFDSYAPLVSARSTHEFHQEPAKAHSHKVHATLPGQGVAALKARLFVFARTKGEGRTAPPAFTLKSLDGASVSFPEKGAYDLGQGWLALTVDLPAGTYGLEQDVPGLGRRAEAVFVEEGWESQVFVPWGEFPDFAKATLFMRRCGQGFEPESYWEYEPTEAALEGLARGRLVLSPNQLGEFLDGKFENPMLGMLACYALLEQSPVDYPRLQYVVSNLLNLIPHSPDARLIALLAKLGEASLPVVAPDNWPQFTEPPILAIGTERLMRLTSAVADLCPAGSWLADIAIRLTTGSAWTRWEADVSADEAFERLYEALQSRLSEPQSHLFGFRMPLLKEAPYDVGIDDLGHARNLLDQRGLHAFSGLAEIVSEFSDRTGRSFLSISHVLAREFRLPWSVVGAALIVGRSAARGFAPKKQIESAPAPVSPTPVISTPASKPPAPPRVYPTSSYPTSPTPPLSSSDGVAGKVSSRSSQVVKDY